MKRIIALLLTGMLLLLAACAAPVATEPTASEPTASEPTASEATASEATASEPSQSPHGTLAVIDEAELNAARELSIVPDGMSTDGNVTCDEFRTLCRNVLAKLGAQAPSEWDNLPAEQELTRTEAAIFLYAATEALDCFTIPKDADYGCLIYGSESFDDDKLGGSGIFEDRRVFVGKNDRSLKNAAIAHAGLYTRYYLGYSLIDPDDAGAFECREPLTRDAAIAAAYRLYRSASERGEYIDISAAAEGCTLLPEQLDNPQSALPEIEKGSMPEYRGMTGHRRWSVSWPTGDSADCYLFTEREIEWMSNHGINMYRVMIGLSSLGFPECPENMVSDKIMRNLDELVAWGIAHDVCINIAIAARPGYTAANDIFADTNFFYDDADEMALMREYTLMLAERYKDVPSKYLFFALDEEPQPVDFDVYNDYIISLADNIWEISPDRALTVSVWPNEWALSYIMPILEHGVNMACNLYEPDYITHFERTNYEKQFCPDGLALPTYPAVYLPSILNGEHPTLNIEGEVGGTKLSFYVRCVAQDGAVLTIAADGAELEKHAFTEADSVSEDGIDYHYSPDESECVFRDFVVDVPEGAASVTISVEGTLQFSRIRIEKNGSVCELSPTTFSTGVYDEVGWDMPTLVVGADGSVTSKDGHMGDSEYIEEWFIKVLKKYSEDCHTGLLITEFGIFPRDFSDISTQLAFNEDLLGMFERNGLGWCFNNYLNPGVGLLRNRLWNSDHDFVFECTERQCAEMPDLNECVEMVEQFLTH